MHRFKPLMLAMCSLLLITVAMGCSKKSEETSSTSYSEKTTTKTDVAVKEVNLGRTVGGDKRIVDPVTTFNPNDVIYASVVTSGTSPNTTLQIRWTYQDGQVVEETQQTITTTAAEEATEFHISKPDGWPAGKYKAEIFVNGDLVQTKEFEVVAG